MALEVGLGGDWKEALPPMGWRRRRLDCVLACACGEETEAPPGVRGVVGLLGVARGSADCAEP